MSGGGGRGEVCPRGVSYVLLYSTFYLPYSTVVCTSMSLQTTLLSGLFYFKCTKQTLYKHACSIVNPPAQHCHNVLNNTACCVPSGIVGTTKQVPCI